MTEATPTELQQAEEMSRQRLGLAWDFFMFVLILLNLTWILFDTFFKSALVQGWVLHIHEGFYHYYATQVHGDFLRYDLYFVSIYLFDLAVRWVIAIHRKTYERWFFFPFAHWYDVLGCIPISSFHLLRLLRVVVMLQRMQRLGFIDLTNTFVYRKFKAYVQILTEEISDRVVIQVLNGVQAEVRAGSPMLHRINQQVLLKRRLQLGDWISQRLTDFVQTSFEGRRDELQLMVAGLVNDAANRTPQITQMRRVPIFGAQAQAMLEAGITSMIYEITDQIMMYLKSEQSTETVHEITSVVFDSLAEPDNQLNTILQSILIESLDLVKAQVKIQQWRSQKV